MIEVVTCECGHQYERSLVVPRQARCTLCLTEEDFGINGVEGEPLGKNGEHAAEGHEPRPARCSPSPRLTIPLTSGCWDCGRSWREPGWVDAWIPDDLWAQIAPIGANGTDGSGHLCIHCITAALTDLGAQDVPIELWAAPFLRGGPVVP